MVTVARPSGHRAQYHLHPVVYRTMAAFAVLMIAASWVFFGHHGTTGYLLAVVTGFVLACLGLPYALRQVRRRDPRPWRGGEPPAISGESFRDWEDDEFQAWRSRLTGKEAMVQALLPIAAVGFGMTALALVLALAV